MNITKQQLKKMSDDLLIDSINIMINDYLKPADIGDNNETAVLVNELIKRYKSE